MSARDHQLKRRKTKHSIIHDYVVDSPYRSANNRDITPEESDSDDSRLLRTMRKPAKSSARRSGVRRPKNKNAKDPFEYLADDVVGIIVSFLPVQVTEVLRRVSKFWKATSEYHNDSRAIRRHFGYLGEGSKSFDSREEANLHFRRLLYHQESLKTGLATRALECSGARFWHVNSGILMWANVSGSVSVRRLRSKNDFKSVSEEAKELDLHDTWPDLSRTLDVQITESGDILTHVEIIQSFQASPKTTRAKLSQGGTIAWAAIIPGSSYEKNIRAAVGKEVIHTIEKQGTEAYLTTRCLVDGAVLRKRHVQPLEDEFEDPYHLTGGLQLTSDEKWVVFKKKNHNVYMFRTTDQGTFSTCAHHLPHGSLVQSKVGNQVWVVDYNCSISTRSILLSPEKGMPKAQEIPQVDRYISYEESSNVNVFGVGFDPDRMLLFRFIKDPFPRILVVRLLEGQFGYNVIFPAPITEIRHTLIERKHGRAVTLPASMAKDPGTRRELKVSLPWTTREGDSFGIIDGYVIHHSIEDDMLLVLDFWPAW